MKLDKINILEKKLEKILGDENYPINIRTPEELVETGMTPFDDSKIELILAPDYDRGDLGADSTPQFLLTEKEMEDLLKILIIGAERAKPYMDKEYEIFEEEEEDDDENEEDDD